MERDASLEGYPSVSLEQGSRCADLSFDGLRVLELYPIIGSISAHCAAVRSLGYGKLIHPTTHNPRILRQVLRGATHLTDNVDTSRRNIW